MTDASPDNFNLAVQVDQLVLAHQMRSAGKLVHAPVDVRTLATIAGNLNLGFLDPDLSSYERVCAIETLVDELPDDKREAIAKDVAKEFARVRWRPLRGAQCMAYERASEVDTLLLAGGAGSSKTDVMIAIAMYLADSARFIRKTLPELHDGVVKRLGEIAGSTEGRNLQAHSWQLSPPYGHRQQGVSINWTGLADEDSKLRMQGRAVSMLGFDDLGSGEVTQADVEFVSRWLRSTSDANKLTVMTANPPNPEAIWLREWFAPWLDPGYPGTPAESGDVRYFLAGEEVDVGTPDAEARCVIKSTVLDNPFLMRADYQRQLANTPDATLRRRLLNNDWSIGLDSDADLQVIPGAWVDAAFDRWTPTPQDTGMDCVGVDVARGGKDRSAIIARHGYWFGVPQVYPGTSTPDGPALAALCLEQMEPGAVAFVDVTGVGGAVVDALRPHAKVVPIVFGGAYKALDVTHSFGFANVRSALWWRLRELLDPANGKQIALPPDRALRAELIAPRYQLRGGKIFVESRQDIIKRTGRSPDIATALILAAIDVNSNLAAPARGFRAALERQRRRQTCQP